ncbi:hypothetical protein BWK49_28765 (plasmid) [Mycobacterium intracellulare subsp. chimaera]|nr:hypothetical protein BWK49_28765 [Mycobacterium intracellulare subsp. chimaera]KKC06414.1 hypothetical protein WU83_03115 [Mycobacterium nebraskense]KPN46622.1 hypothetical protein AN932_23455 [Mycobacterium intracellulare subsp. chimaera]
MSISLDDTSKHLRSMETAADTLPRCNNSSRELEPAALPAAQVPAWAAAVRVAIYGAPNSGDDR